MNEHTVLTKSSTYARLTEKSGYEDDGVVVAKRMAEVLF